MIILLALCGGVVAFLILYLFFAMRLAPQARRKQRNRIILYASNTPKPTTDLDNLEKTPFFERAILPLFDSISQQLIHLAPTQIHNVFRKRIIQAGKQNIWNVNIFVSFWVISLISGGVIATLLALMCQLPTFRLIAFCLLGVFIGGLLPIAILDSLIRKRQAIIRRELPDVMDLLCVSVQAGLSFDTALVNITQRMKGPFIDECNRMLRDVRMGMTHHNALTNLAARCNLQEVYLFTSAIIQSERLGVSMGKTLLIQADNMRERRRQYIKAQSVKAPLKIIFPLIIFIFPAIFVVTLLPAILNIIKIFQK